MDRVTAVAIVSEICNLISHDVHVESIFLNTFREKGQYAIMLKVNSTDHAIDLIKPILEEHNLVMSKHGEFIFLHSV